VYLYVPLHVVTQERIAMATVYKRGKTYWIKWYENGVAKYESLKTQDKKDALVAKAAKELQLRTGAPVAQINITVAEFAEQYLLWHSGEYPWAKKEMRYYFDSVVIPEFGKTRMASLDPQLVELWKHKRLGSIGHRSKRPVSRATVNNELKKLKAMLNKAVEWGVIQRNPVMSVKTLQRMDARPRSFFTKEQLQAIYDADPSMSAIWQLLANTGMRVGEAMNLKWEDVNEKTIRVLSTKEHATKTRQWRDIPLSPGAASSLRHLESNDEYVLPRMCKMTLRTRFKKACAKAGVVGTPHELRHTFISQLVMQGIPLRTVQVLAGHSTIAVTEKYSHLSPDHLASAVSGLSL
jgi:integrase